jgi:hypothetical protein
MKRNYYKIKFYSDSGRLEIEDINETNFHPSQVNEIYNSVSDKKDFAFMISKQGQVKKNCEKMVKHFLNDFKKQLSVYEKKVNSCEKAMQKVDKFSKYDK